jgi:hypothetical protein
MRNQETEGFMLEVRLMDDPCLWRWDIREPVQNAIVRSSWEQDWTAYPSREEAVRAGQDQLRRVIAGRSLDTLERWRVVTGELATRKTRSQF